MTNQQLKQSEHGIARGDLNLKQSAVTPTDSGGRKYCPLGNIQNLNTRPKAKRSSNLEFQSRQTNKKQEFSEKLQENPKPL